MTALLSSNVGWAFDKPNPTHLVIHPAQTLTAFPIDLARRTADAQARLMCRSGAVAVGDEDDVSQEMVIAAWQRWHYFDPGTASASTFLLVVMRNVSSSLIRSTMALKRRPRVAGVARKLLSFDHAIDRPQIDSRLPNVDSRLDLEELMKTLPVDLQTTCRLLTRGSIADAARALGVPRHHVVGQIREVRIVLQMRGFGPSRAGRHPCQ